MDINAAKRLLNRKHKRPGKEFLDLIAKDGYVIAPGCFSAMGAAIVRMVREETLSHQKSCAYNAVYGSGWAVSAMDRYQPDKGFHHRGDIIAKADRLVEGAFPLPVIMDGETGFGPRLAIPELIKGFHNAGVSVVHLEDQNPDLKGCGHHGGNQVDELETFLAKLRIAIITLEALGSDMLIMARTDAFAASNGGFKETIRRGKAFADLRVEGCFRGVDLVWPEFPTADPGPAREFAQEMLLYKPGLKLGFNFSPNLDHPAWYKTHSMTPLMYDDYARMGYVLQFHTVWEAKLHMSFFHSAMSMMAENGAQALYDFQDAVRGETTASGQTMSRTPEYQELDQLVGGDEVIRRYAASKGFGAGLHDVMTEKK